MAAVSPATTTADEQRSPHASHSKWVYTLEAACALPVVDLDDTLVARLLPPAELEWFHAVMTTKYKQIGRMYRLALLLVLVMLFVPKAIGRWITLPVAILSAPAMVLSLLMNSVDLMKLLTRHYEFWFFTILNTINWACLASFYSDVRVFSLFAGVAGTQLVILTDASFRAVVSGIRTSLVAVPVIFVLATAVFYRFIDTPEANYRVISVAGVKVLLADIFTNTAITLAIFISRKAYLRRKLLTASGETLKTIRCVVVRVKLRLKPQTSMIHGISSPTTAKHETPARPKRTESHQQPLVLVPLALPSIDIRDLVVHRWSPLNELLPRPLSLLLCFSGVVGSVSTVVTLTRSPRLVGSQATAAESAIASIMFTLVFFCCFAANFHRALANSLLRNFDFLFTSVQLTVSMLLISDMMQWDFRILGTLAWLLWFHLVLFLDALTPPIKQKLRFRKIFLLPVVVATLVGIVFIIYEFFFTGNARFFRDRTLLSFNVHSQTIALRTKSLLINRLGTVLLWSCRLMWEVAVCPENELTFIRGHLEYYTPLPMFPPLIPTPSDAGKIFTGRLAVNAVHPVETTG